MPSTHEPAGDPPVVPGYRIGELLGAGATGSVWEAVRETDGVAVAVKLVPVGAEGPEASVAARELGVLASVEVEGLVGFHEALGLRDDPPAVAIVLDLVRGGSLQRAVSARGHLSVGESVTVLAPVARALAGLHAAGVVHGDVSPSNVLLERSGRPLLADLGVARLAGEQPGELFGTPGFVAPEVLDGAAPTAASDVYAVGALAWWCVTGGAPGPAALRRPLEELAPGLPQAWRAATTAALRGVPGERPSAADLALAYFDAAPCEPLRLVVGTDETSLLTARLRSTPPDALAAPAPASRPRLLRRPAWVRMPQQPLPELRLPKVRVPALHPGRRGMVLVAVLVAVVAVTSLVLDRPHLPWARAAESPTPARSSADTAAGGQPGARTAAASTGTTAGPVRGLVSEHASAGRDPRGLMQELSDLRAHAMNTASRSDLAALDAPRSPALAQDSADLERLRGSGRAYSGVGLRVRSANVLAVSGDRASVRAVVDTTAYQVVSRAGTAQTQPARPGEPMRFTLRWDGARWQVERVEAL